MKIDLITGLLGAGKTTFIKQYVRYLVDQGEEVCILVNDYGAISVDMALLHYDLGEICDLEMVTAGDWDCYLRRTKTKLIQMAMFGYDRIIVEPSGVFDADDFYDILRDEPLDRWYQIGAVLSLVDAHLSEELSEEEAYLLLAEACTAGKILISKLPRDLTAKEEEKLQQHILDILNRQGKHFHCERVFEAKDILAKSWEDFTTEDYQLLSTAGMVHADMQKMHVAEQGSYETLFFYRVQRSQEKVVAMTQDLLKGSDYGNVIRVKGLFCDSDTQKWYQINATGSEMEIQPMEAQKEVMLVIGEHLHHDRIKEVFGETRDVLDYEV